MTIIIMFDQPGAARLTNKIWSVEIWFPKYFRVCCLQGDFQSTLFVENADYSSDVFKDQRSDRFYKL